MRESVPPDPKKSEGGESGLPSIAPDVVEQEQADEIDNIIPTRGYQMLPTVALGGSAGSIPALQKFFSVMPPNSGMAFVVVLHLSSDHESIMDEIIGRSTSMKVLQATDQLTIEANTVYVIPPGKFISAADGRLRLTPLEPDRGKRVAVDLFFRTLADAHGPHAAAIVLSGADGDGALGIKRIKERGGLTIAQDPEEAEHGSMPRTAIDTGMVDWVLPVEEMPARLVEYQANAKRLQLPSEDGPQPAKALISDCNADENALRDVLGFLRSRTERDFSYYKRATVVRRVSRRMQVNGTQSMQEYLRFLRTHPGEAGALQQDMLISVTNFFRDRDAFKALEAEIPAIFTAKTTGNVIRVWTAGCATGEEAYSVAMLLLEQADKMDSPPTIQVFATDLAEEVIAVARDGLYPLTIHADVSEERLRRFFVKEHRGYRARRELRECVLFAVHDLLKDAPFSRMDLFTCRNLLIYLTTEAQTRALEIAHFALKPEGRLFIGVSETVDEESQFWMPIDKKYRLFKQCPVAKALGLALPVPIGPSTLERALHAQERAKGGPFVHGPSFSSVVVASVERDAERIGRRVSWEELHFKLIERFSPPSLIVTRDYDIVHTSENAGRFLHFTGGEPSVNLIKVVHPMLRIELRAALFRAAQSSTTAEVFQVPMELEGQAVTVDIRVSPAQEIAPDYLLVVFEVRKTPDGEAVQARQEAEPAVRHLEREMEHMKIRLRETVEQYDASSEELKASNEELQAMNEELRSSAEELETSREELQSVNEELTTVNQELKGKVDDLGRANSDLANLMSATGVATIFMDRTLHITRYTPSAVALFRLIASDLGRPLTDLNHRLNYSELKSDSKLVLERLIPVKREVTDGERWYLAQLLPYRTNDDRIAGVVLTVVDITESRIAQHALRESEERMRFAMEAAKIYGWETDTESGRTNFLGNTERVLGFAVPEDLQRMMELIHPDDRAKVGERFQKAKAEMSKQSEQSGGRFDAEFRMIHPRTGELVWQSSHGLFTVGSDGKRRFVGITQNITERRQAEEAFRVSEERFRLIVENAREYAIFTLDLDRRVKSWGTGAELLLGYAESEIVGQLGDVIFTPEDRAAGVPAMETQTALAQGRAADERWHVRKGGSVFWGSGVMMSMNDSDGKAIGMVKVFRDHTEQMQARRALEKSEAELWEALQAMQRAREQAEASRAAKDHFLAVLSHELRTPLTPVLMAVRALARHQDLPPVVADALEMINRNVQLEARFIDDLLDVTRIERGKLELQLEEVDVHQVVRHALEVSAADIEGKKQRLTINLEAGRHVMQGDILRLQQVFWNLLKNASKFTEEGGSIEVRSRNIPGRLVITVSDSGIGFVPEVAARIFNPFDQADVSVTRKYGGLGLGLAIAKATVEGHGGSLSAESAGSEKGSTFTVDLPLPPDANGGAESAALPSPDTMLGKRPPKAKRTKQGK